MISFILTLKRLLQGIYHGFKDKKFLALFVVMLATLLSGTIFYSSVEEWDWIDALYFSAVTLTTVVIQSFLHKRTLPKSSPLFICLQASVSHLE